MADVSDPALMEAVLDVHDDSTETNWCAFGYKDKTTIELKGTGSGGHDELMELCTTDVILYCLLRVLDGDRESQRVKFVYLTFSGEGAPGFARGRVGVHVGSVKPLMGQCNIDMFAENQKECTMATIKKKLKVAGGADYDTGSNAAGYKPTENLRNKALEAYRQKEKETTIKGVVYVTSALPNATPHTLENYPHFLVVFYLASQDYPVTSALCGLTYLASRVVAAKGYYTGDVTERQKGAFGYFANFTLTGLVLVGAARRLGWL